MRMTWGSKIAGSLCCAVLLVGCRGGSDGQFDDRRGQLGQPAQYERLSLTGCIQSSPGTDQYVLSNVRLAHPAEQPQADTMISRGPAITEGSWVRLTGDPGLIQRHMGQQVTVMGTVTLDDARRVGTAGGTEEAVPGGAGGDRSRAAGTEHYAQREKEEVGPIGQDSIASEPQPSVQVQRIDATGERCRPELHPNQR